MKLNALPFLVTMSNSLTVSASPLGLCPSLALKSLVLKMQHVFCHNRYYVPIKDCNIFVGMYVLIDA